MKWFWYIGNEYEIFADLDLSRKTLKRMSVSRARLYGAIESRKLDFDSYAYYDSNTDYHYHLMIKLKSPISEHRKLIWESRFCDDMFRNDMNHARLLETGKSWSLLISSSKREGWREPDYVCFCESKHKGDVMKNCPISTMINCCLSVDNFGDAIYLEDKVNLGRIENHAAVLHRLESYRKKGS